MNEISPKSAYDLHVKTPKEAESSSNYKLRKLPKYLTDQIDEILNTNSIGKKTTNKQSKKMTEKISKKHYSLQVKSTLLRLRKQGRHVVP